MSSFQFGKYSLVEWSPNNGENIIFPWGVETADSDGFFSLDRTAGYRYQCVHEHIQHQDRRLFTEQEVIMRDGHWVLKTADLVNGGSVIRHISLSAMEDSWQMDFVMRFRFKKEFFSHAEIAGKRIDHLNSNIYHQYPVSAAKLVHELGELSISILEVDGGSSFEPEMYVRDRGDEWIIHVRLMPKRNTRQIIKMCNRYMKTKSLPNWFSNIVLLIAPLKKALWYRGEQRPYSLKLLRILNPNAFALGQVKKGETLSLKVVCQWN